MKEANRDRKNPIKAINKIQLDDGQKEAKAGVYEKDVSIFLGNFGSGKTLTAVSTALDLLLKKHIDKIFITRPIDFEATGFLKGSAQEKMAFHIYPIKQNMYDSYDKQKVDLLFEEGVIQIVPIDYMKGYTFTNSCTIVDEFEDISYDEFKLILTRLGVGSKLIFTGSEEQIGVKNSCIPRIKKLQSCDLVNFHILKGQHRNENIQKILDYLDSNA